MWVYVKHAPTRTSIMRHERGHPVKPYLEMQNISKTFPGVKALKNVSLDVYKGEVLALVGENGAGKSTLMKILSGMYQPDSGEESRIMIDGKQVCIMNTVDASMLGINILYQELATVENLNVAENLFLGREIITKLGFTNKRLMIKKSGEILKSLNMDIDPTAQVSTLSIGQQQMVEIAKAISHHSQIIVMDEPTASLSYKETRTLINLIFDLKKQGIGIIYISHRLEEIFEIADRVTVLRDGESVGTMSITEATTEKLVKMMVDRELCEMYCKTKSYTQDDVVLEVKNLGQDRKKSEHGLHIENINFKLHKGEILGFSGLVGSGRTEIMQLIFGVFPHVGEIYIDGKEANIKSPDDAIKYGIGFATEDRKNQGLVLGMSVRENFSLTFLERLSQFGFVDKIQEKKLCSNYIESLEIKTPSQEQTTRNLSGGNQQKIIIAKWIARHPKVLIVDEPTRGIDVGAKAEVHQLLTELAAQGIGIIMVSSELPEIMAMSDRIIVIKDCKIAGEIERCDATQEVIMKCAAIGDGPEKQRKRILIPEVFA